MPSIHCITFPEHWHCISGPAHHIVFQQSNLILSRVLRDSMTRCVCWSVGQSVTHSFDDPPGAPYSPCSLYLKLKFKIQMKRLSCKILLIMIRAALRRNVNGDVTGTNCAIIVRPFAWTNYALSCKDMNRASIKFSISRKTQRRSYSSYQVSM